MAKIAISLPDSMLGDVDRVARERNMARSEIIRKGVEAFLEAERFRHTVARAQKIYAEIALEEMALAETYRPIIAETTPVYHIEEEDR
jgi:metal-responsive CopG/Arc/MetJ family transcriptional regulator